MNPDRVVVKRVVLTGQPFKATKKKATVRFMFNHPDDVRWFRQDFPLFVHVVRIFHFFSRPVELWTKLGLRGHIRCVRSSLICDLRLMYIIREPLGTHGYMKCAFDGVINQQDTVRIIRDFFSYVHDNANLASLWPGDS